MEKWRHKKRGTIYEVLGVATIQCEPSADIADGEALMLYRGEDGSLWVRRAADGGCVDFH